jgi:citrate synthase
MMFSDVYEEYEAKPEVVRALNLILLLHADHEQNCSTSTVRMVASSQANLFASPRPVSVPCGVRCTAARTWR